MASSHSASRHIEYIQQALSQNKKPIGFFIGAGCPLSVRINLREEAGEKKSDPLIPDIAGLTSRIAQKLAGEKGKPTSFDKLQETLIADGIDAPNIEQILTQIRALRSVAGKGEVRGFKAKELEDLDREICKIVVAEVDKELPDRLSPYHNLAVWAHSLQRDQPVHIFTTNYDLLVEQAFEESSAPYFDGFIGTRKAFFDLGAVENEKLLHPRWSRLWKIHGSINWRLEEKKDASEGVKKHSVIRSDKQDDKQGYLIYPSHLKYDQSRKMPYLAMLDRLKSFLLTPSAVMFISGYSFSDDHINDVICETLSANPTAMVYALLFDKLDDDKYVNAKDCAMNTQNLSVLAFDKAIIGRVEAVWSHKEEDLTATSIPAGILAIYEDAASKEKICQVKLGDFFKFGLLLKGLNSLE